MCSSQVTQKHKIFKCGRTEITRLKVSLEKLLYSNVSACLVTGYRFIRDRGRECPKNAQYSKSFRRVVRCHEPHAQTNRSFMSSLILHG